MGWIIQHPFKQLTKDIGTSQNITRQAWHSISMFQYYVSDYPELCRAQTAQAESYFMDALNSHWRSSGLLYYYSFLNLAKALYYMKMAVKSSEKFHHGISGNRQPFSDISKYEITVNSSDSSHTKNTFAWLYKLITEDKWPWSSSISIPISEILPYCSDIGDEIKTLYGINQRRFVGQSLLRYNTKQAWFEAIASSKVESLIKNLNSTYRNLNFSNHFDEIDKQTWLLSYGRTASSLRGHVKVTTQPIMVPDESSLEQALQQSCDDIMNQLNGSIIPTVEVNEHAPRWIYVAPIQLKNEVLKWHPLLSSYLLSFALSEILRYEPQLLEDGKQDSFLAEAWCNQAPGTVLRYFLMFFTTPSVRIYKIE